MTDSLYTGTLADLNCTESVQVFASHYGYTLPDWWCGHRMAYLTGDGDLVCGECATWMIREDQFSTEPILRVEIARPNFTCSDCENT